MKAVRNLIAEAGVPEIKNLDAVHHEKGNFPRALPGNCAAEENNPLFPIWNLPSLSFTLPNTEASAPTVKMRTTMMRAR